MARYKPKSKNSDPEEGAGKARQGFTLRPLDTPRPLRAALAFGGLFALIFLGMECFYLNTVVLEGRIFFQDPDAYTWLDRADRVLSGQGLFVHHDPMDNYPEGYPFHWTQPFQWTLALFAGLLAVFGAGEGALEWAGLWIAPLFGCFTACMLGAWIFRRWPWLPCLLAAFTFLINPFEVWTFATGRPDHQCLLIFLLTAAILLLLDLEKDGKRRTLKIHASGILVAAGVWVSVQALGVWALLLGVWVLQCGLASPEERPCRIRDGMGWCLASAGAALLFALVERKGDLFYVVSDSMSTGQALFMAMPGLGLYCTAFLLRKGKGLTRTAWFFLATVPAFLFSLLAALWLWQYQEAAYGPEVLDAMGRWFDQNLEFIPALFMVEGKMGLGRFHESFGYSFYALPFLLYGVARTRLLDARGRWILGAGLLFGSLLTLWQIRWRDIHSLVIALVTAVGVCEVVARFFPQALERLKPGNLKSLGWGFIPLGVCSIVLLPWLSISFSYVTSCPPPRPDFQALRLLSEWIRDKDPLQEGEENPAVMTAWDMGPMVKYWSGRPVIASPYHRNMEGMLDSMAAYTARSEEAFVKIASRRRIRYLLRTPLADPKFDCHSFEGILGVEDPATRLTREVMTPDGMGVIRGYGLNPAMTREEVESILCFRLESNQWIGWSHLEGIAVPGLEQIRDPQGATPFSHTFPYLYRYKN